MNYESKSPVHPVLDITGEFEGGEAPILLEVKRAVLAQKLRLAIIMAATLAIGIISTILATPYYTSTTRIQIDREDDNVTNVESVEGLDYVDNEEFYLTQYAILESRALAGRVANSLDLTNSEEFFDMFGLEGEIAESESAGSASGSTAEREKLVVTTLLEHLTVTPVAGSRLVDISFATPNRRESARIANEWVRQYIAMNIDRRFSSTEDARKFLTDRLGELRERMEASERQLVTYADNQEIVRVGGSSMPTGDSAGQGSTLVAADLRALNQELAQATAQRIAAGARMAASESSTTESSTLAGLRQRRAEIRSEYAKLLAQFEPEYPAAKALESQLSNLDSSIAQEERRSQGVVAQEYRAAQAREEALRSRVSQLTGELSAEQRESIQLNIYQREVDANRALYDGLLQRYKEIGVAGVGSNNIAVIDQAEVPKFPSSPNLSLNLALALLGGLLLSGGYLFVVEHTRTAIREPSEVAKFLNIASLGGIPLVDDFDPKEELFDSKSLTWEAYSSVETSLSLVSENGVPPSFMLTSAQPNEGKTTSSTALAGVLASRGRRVLLIDGDMRNPSLHRLLGTKNASGLVNFLSGSDDWQRSILTIGDNLDLMPSGPLPPDAAQLLSGPRMSTLIDLTKRSYDHVIVDSPPVLGLADAQLIALATSGIVFTISANSASIDQIRSAIGRLRMTKVPIFGAITTRIDSASQYGYYDYYSYGSNDKNAKD